MASRLLDELGAYVLQDVTLKAKRLGTGSYGSVVEAEIPGAICAIKVIHEHLVVGHDYARGRFVEECKLMSSLRHPHIVQFLGLCAVPGSPFPGLVMERLRCSLDDLLENSPSPEQIPLSVKRCILHDVARGLTFLHKRPDPIVHRDLSARNVLLNSAMEAKISDFGVARIVDIRSTMTAGPGAISYMPPEAMESGKYGTPIDIFSFGHLALFTLIQKFPVNLKAHNYYDDDEGILKARTEVERRDEYFTLLYSRLTKNHPLVSMTEQCLCNSPQKRPKIEVVSQVLDAAKTLVSDRFDNATKLELIQMIQETEAKKLEGPANQSTVQSPSDQQHVVKMQLLPPPPVQQPLLPSLSVQQPLPPSPSVQQLLLPSPSVRQSVAQEQEPLVRPSSSQSLPSHRPHVEWTRKKDMPFGMERATAVFLNAKVYIAGEADTELHDQSILVYDSNKDDWDEIAECPTIDFGMATFQSELVIVGGREECTLGGHGQLSTRQASKKWFVWKELNRSWHVSYPIMPAVRVLLSAIGYKNYLIVIGGDSANMTNPNTLVFNATTREWLWASPTPLQLFRASLSISSDTLYALMGIGNQGYFISVIDILCAASSKADNVPQVAWKTLPLTFSSARGTIFQNQIIAAGGSTMVHREGLDHVRYYNTTTDRWERFSKLDMDFRLPVSRSRFAIVSISDEMIFIAGGYERQPNEFIKEVYVGKVCH